MKETLGAILGAISAFLVTVAVGAFTLGEDDMVLGLLSWAISPIIGAIIGGVCFHRIRWHRKSVILTTRCAIAAALPSGAANLLFQIYYTRFIRLPDFDNSLAQFLYAALFGAMIGILIGRVLSLHFKIDAVQQMAQLDAETTNEIWPPPPTYRAD